VFLERKMIRNLTLKLAVTTGILFINQNVLAAEDDTIIVTATRTAQTADDTLASVTVITKEQIEQKQPNDIPELLHGMQGIDISNSGGLGKVTSIYMRGTNSSHLLVLVDGMRIGSATLGLVSLQDIPVSQVERIEVVRGPRASLYGSDAIGGVIQVFTKKAYKDKINLSLGYGSQNTGKISAGFNSIKGKNQFSLNIAYLESKGINSHKTSDKDEDGYKNSSLSANFKHNFSNQSYFTATFFRTQGNNEYDDQFTATNIVDSDFSQQTAGINYVFQAMDNWQMDLKLNQSQDNSDNFKNGAANGSFNTKRDFVSWQNNLTLSESLILTAGIDYQNDEVNSTTAYDKTTRNNTGYYAQQQWLGENNDIIAAIRVDDNEAFGSHTTGNISWGTNLDNNLRLIASYGTGFKAPTFNNLYFPSSGDSTIKPEESKSYEIELRKKFSNGRWNINFYQTKITNLIVYPAPTYQVTNLDKATIEGVEIAVLSKQKSYNINAQLGFIDPTNDATKKILPRRSKQSFKLNIDQNSGKWRSGMEIIVKGSRYENTSNSTKLSGYSLVNVNTGYTLSKKWTLRGKVNNLLSENYQTANNYNTEGTGVYVSVHYTGD